jgi:hypothetical protein
MAKFIEFHAIGTEDATVSSNLKIETIMATYFSNSLFIDTLLPDVLYG